MKIELNTEKETLTDLRRIKRIIDSRIAEMTDMDANLSPEEAIALYGLRELAEKNQLVSVKDFEKHLLHKGIIRKEELQLIMENLRSKGEAYQPKEGFLSPI